MAIVLWDLRPGLPRPSSVTSHDGALNSRKGEDGQDQVSGPKRLWALLHVWSTPARAPDDSSSTTGNQQGHLRCPKWGQNQHFLSTLSSLCSLHLITGTRPWPAANPVPTKGWLHCRRLRVQKQLPLPALASSCIGLQHRGLSFFLPSEPAQAERNLKPL